MVKIRLFNANNYIRLVLGGIFNFLKYERGELMTRQELRARFRVESPEITERVITDSQLNTMMLDANLEVSCETRCIVRNEPIALDSVEDQQFYDLQTLVPSFYAIDDLPGDGVSYDGSSLDKSSPGEEKYLSKTWRSREAGTPKRYWLRGGRYLWLDRKPDTSDLEILVECVLYPEDFDGDSDEPFNGLEHLQVFAPAIIKYCQWQTKAKVGKPEESAIAYNVYAKYVAWMKKTIKGGKHGAIFIKPA